jgi:hypothetical protein
MKWYNRQSMNQKHEADDFWTQDTFLFQGDFRYYHNKKRPVRGKMHTSEETYRLDSRERDIRPMETRKGRRTSVMMHPYVFEPILTLTVGLYTNPQQYADQESPIGETIGAPKQEGTREVQIGSAQAWYYHDDKILEIWECFLDARFRTHPFAHDPHMQKLWQQLEVWLTKQFPEATRMVTPCNDPIAETIEEYQEFLRSLGYTPVASLKECTKSEQGIGVAAH